MVLTIIARIAKIGPRSSKIPPDQIYFQRGECKALKGLISISFPGLAVSSSHRLVLESVLKTIPLLLSEGITAVKHP